MHGPNDISFLQPIWDTLLITFGRDFFEFPLHFFPAIFAVILFTGIVFSVLDCALYKKYPAQEAVVDGLKTLSGYAVVALLAYGLHVWWEPLVMPVPSEAPLLTDFLFQVFGFLVLGELLTYAWHRVEHRSTFVFRTSHHVHHACKLPISVWTNFFLHPTEGFMVMLCLYLSPYLLGAHPLVFWGFAFMSTFAMVMTHCGYTPRFYPTWLFPSPAGHDLHHEHRVPVNFSVVMAFGDRLFGTYKPPEPGR